MEVRADETKGSRPRARQQEVLELVGLLLPVMMFVVLESVAGEGALRKARPGGGTSK